MKQFPTDEESARRTRAVLQQHEQRKRDREARSRSIKVSIGEILAVWDNPEPLSEQEKILLGRK